MNIFNWLCKKNGHKEKSETRFYVTMPKRPYGGVANKVKIVTSSCWCGSCGSRVEESREEIDSLSMPTRSWDILRAGGMVEL